MLHLGVATRETTFERMRQPLADRGIAVSFVHSSGRHIHLTSDGDAFESIDVGYVYPSRIMEGGVADALLDVAWVNDRRAVLTSRNKAEVLASARRAGLAVPDSIVVSNPVEEESLVEVWEAIEGPVVVKPNSTTRGVGVARAEDLDTFLGITDYLDLTHDFRATGDKSFVVQEFVRDARDIRVMVLEGEYVGAVERKRSDGWKHNVHRGATATGIDPDEEIKHIAERVADVLDITILGVDFLVTEDGPLLSETNARPTIDPDKYEPDFWDRLAEAIRRRA